MTDLVLVGVACLMVGAVIGLGIAFLMGAGAKADDWARADFLEGECARLLADRDAAYERGRKFALGKRSR